MERDSAPLYPQGLSYMQTPKKEMSQPTAPPVLQQSSQLLGPDNTVTTCPFCQASIKTAVKHTTTTRTHIVAALCCFICCLCCIPYCSDSAKNSDHYCPNCQRYIGTYEK